MLEAFEPVGRRAGAQRRRELDLQLIHVPPPGVRRIEARIADQLGTAELLAELAELRVVARADDDLAAVGSLEGLERSDVRMAGAQPARERARDEVRSERVLQDG